MGEMPDGTMEPDTPPARGAHQQWWMDLTPEQRVTHYNRHLSKGCTHKASLSAWPEILREAYSFDPGAHVSHSVEHSVKGFFDGTCECQSCINNVGIERGSPFEYATRKRKAVDEQLT